MEFKTPHDSENIISPAEPHLGSFVPETPTQESETAPVFEDIDPEEQKDTNLSIIFVLIGALTLISGVGYFIKNRIEPTRTSIVSELYVSDSDVTQKVNSETENTSMYGFVEQGNFSNKYQERIEEQSIVTPTEETFAKQPESIASSTANNVKYTVSETVIRVTPSSNERTTINRTQTLTEKVNSNALGISFLKDPFWKETTKGKSMILKNVGPNAGDTISMIRFRGTSVITEDPKYGNVTYLYDKANKVWMKINNIGNSLIEEEISPEIFVPTQTTKYGKPIFEGTSRYKTLIIAFGFEDFLIVNINGTGYTNILDSFVKEISNF